MDSAFSRQRVQVNGVNLNVTTAGDPSAPMMLFLHGFPEYSGMWHGLMRAFMDRAYCVAPDQRGYNGSDAPSEVSFYRAPNMAKDAATLIAQLSSSGKAIVIGHDWGRLLPMR